METAIHECQNKRTWECKVWAKHLQHCQVVESDFIDKTATWHNMGTPLHENFNTWNEW